MIYTCAVFRAAGSKYSHVCPRVSSAVKPFYWFNVIKVSMQNTSQYNTRSSSCQVCTVPIDSVAWNLREPNKNIFCGSNVSGLKLCTTDKLWETLRVPVCCPAHVLEVVFPPTSLTMTLRMSCHGRKALVVWMWPKGRKKKHSPTAILLYLLQNSSARSWWGTGIFWNDTEIPEINHWPYLNSNVRTNDHIMADIHCQICSAKLCNSQSKVFLLQPRSPTTKISSV